MTYPKRTNQNRGGKLAEGFREVTPCGVSLSERSVTSYLRCIDGICRIGLSTQGHRVQDFVFDDEIADFIYYLAVGQGLKSLRRTDTGVQRKLERDPDTGKLYSTPAELLLNHKIHLLRGVLEILLDRYHVTTVCTASVHSFWTVTHDWTLESFVKRAKYCTACPLALALKQQLPIAPFEMGFHLFKGSLKNKIQRAIITGGRKNMKLCWSLLQAKRACAVVDDSFIDGSLHDHRKILGEAPPLIPEEMLARFSEKFDLLWKGIAPLRDNLFRPSSSASFNQKRSEGGQEGFFLRTGVDNLIVEDPWEAGEYIETRSRDFCSLTFDELIEIRESGPNKTVELRGYLPGFFNEILDEAIKESISEREELGAPPQGWAFTHRCDKIDFGWSLSLNGEIGSLRAKVQPILEPLKVRLITVGQEYSYFLAQGAQRLMHSHLKKMPQFAPIGRPIELSDLVRTFDMNFGGFVSGDYSAATDRISMTLTRLCMESFLFHSGVHDPELTSVLRRSLYEHVLEYPKGRAHTWDDLPQTNGQLMGGLLSFPILCAINAVCAWLAEEDVLGESLRFEDLPILVNGDDILFQATPELYCRWQEVIKMAGFVLSVGKNYYHDRFFTINSELWDANTAIPERLHFFNVGLLTGQSKLTSKSTQVRPIWDWHQKVLEGSLTPDRAHRRFCHYHKDDIARVTNHGKYNLFISRDLGGLGFKLPENVEVTYTRFNRVVARICRKRLSLDIPFAKYKKLRIGLVEEKGNQPSLVCWKSGVVRHTTRPPDFPCRVIPSITDSPLVMWAKADKEKLIRGLRFSRSELHWLRSGKWTLEPTKDLQDQLRPFLVIHSLSKLLTTHGVGECNDPNNHYLVEEARVPWYPDID